MKRLAYFITLFLMVANCYGLGIHTNYESFVVQDSVSPEYDAFDWDWSGFDSQQIKVDVDVAVTNVGFRMSYPKKGTVYLDLQTVTNISAHATSVVVEVMESVTQQYGYVISTNVTHGATNRTVTYTYYVDFYTNRLTESIITTNIGTNYTTASTVYTTNGIGRGNNGVGEAVRIEINIKGIRHRPVRITMRHIRRNHITVLLGY